jgi:ribonuclease Z
MGQPLADFVYQGLHLLGSSLAGEETYVVAPELNLAFDIGRAPREVVGVEHVFLSHGHTDHAAGIIYYFAQREFIGNQPGNLYVPQPLVEPAQKLLRAWGEIDGHIPPANILGVAPGEDVQLRRDLVVRPFEVNHPCRRPDGSVIAALGFAAIDVRYKLIEEYRDLTGPQLVELKKQGVQITRRVEIPLVAYCGDTRPGDFLELDFVRNSKVLLLECTFVEPGHVDRARAGNHLYVRDLREVIPRLNNERILLTHLTRRTALSVARSLLRRELGELMDERISFFMEHRPRGRRRRPTGEGPDSSTGGGEPGSVGSSSR